MERNAWSVGCACVCVCLGNGSCNNNGVSTSNWHVNEWNIFTSTTDMLHINFSVVVELGSSNDGFMFIFAPLARSLRRCACARAFLLSPCRCCFSLAGVRSRSFAVGKFFYFPLISFVFGCVCWRVSITPCHLPFLLYLQWLKQTIRE